MKRPMCTICNDTGTIETGNNDLPCDCEAGDLAVFNICEVKGRSVTGAEVKLHYLNSSPVKEFIRNVSGMKTKRKSRQPVTLE